jgi:hypothetical protein
MDNMRRPIFCLLLREVFEKKISVPGCLKFESISFHNGDRSLQSTS